MNALLTDSQELFQPKYGNRQNLKTFAQWHKFLKVLSKCHYWDVTPAKQQCTHIFDNVSLAEEQKPPMVKREGTRSGTKKSSTWSRWKEEGRESRGDRSVL